MGGAATLTTLGVVHLEYPEHPVRFFHRVGSRKSLILLHNTPFIDALPGTDPCLTAEHHSI